MCMQVPSAAAAVPTPGTLLPGGPALLRLRNCPFYPLAAQAPDLVRGVNQALLAGFQRVPHRPWQCSTPALIAVALNCAPPAQPTSGSPGWLVLPQVHGSSACVRVLLNWRGPGAVVGGGRGPSCGDWERDVGLWVDCWQLTP